MKLTDGDIKALNEVSAKLNIHNPLWLKDLIYFETASTNNPKIKNPLSSARGLIQFINSTAQELGYPGGSKELVEKYPTYSSQLKGPVYEYLKRYAPYNQEYQLYMAVFYPAARKYPPNMSFKEIFKKRYPKRWESMYKTFIKANPGILTPAHYVAYLKKKPLRTIGIISLVSIVVIAMAIMRIKAKLSK